MSRESAKAKYTRLSGDPEVGYISPDDVMDAIDIMYDDMTSGPVVDASVAADADIARTKIAGTALTSESMGVFNVKDYGAVDHRHRAAGGPGERAHVWRIADAYSYAVATDVPNPGKDEAVVTDAQILAAVEAIVAPDTPE